MVTRDTAWPPGTPNWVDVSVDDVSRAITFYSRLFGWDIPPGSPEFGGYSMATKNGRMVAGVGPKMAGPDSPSVWVTYFATADADQTARKITEAGGHIVAPPMDVMEQGRFAVAVDTAGAAFGVWQAGQTKGVGLANEPGSLTWSEHMSQDFEASKAFYSSVFGYDYQDMSSDGFVYAMLMLNGHEVGGIGKADSGAPNWTSYFAVEDADNTVALAEGLGGRVLDPAQDSAYGRNAKLADDQGAVFKVITPPTPPGQA